MSDQEWSVTLTDFETACDLAAGRGHKSDDPDEVNELFYCEDEEVETTYTFETREQAIAFAKSEYRSQPPNWPTIRGPNCMAVYDGVTLTWEKTR